MITVQTRPDDAASAEAYITPEAVAELLSCSRRWVIERSTADVLPAHKLPGSNRYRYLRSEIEAALRGGEAA